MLDQQIGVVPLQERFGARVPLLLRGGNVRVRAWALVPLQDIFGHAHLGCWLLLQIVCGSMRFGAEPAAGCGITFGAGVLVPLQGVLDDAYSSWAGCSMSSVWGNRPRSASPCSLFQ